MQKFLRVILSPRAVLYASANLTPTNKVHLLRFVDNFVNISLVITLLLSYILLQCKYLTQKYQYKTKFAVRLKFNLVVTAALNFIRIFCFFLNENLYTNTV